MSGFIGITAAIQPIEFSQPTLGLRFLGGRLQQLHEVTRDDGAGTTRRLEWRDVPSVDLADATPKETLP